jgi:protoheme IX farnesyltransferase
MSDFLLLTKFRLSMLVLLTTATGYYMAIESSWSPSHFLLALLGTALLAGAASALNQVLEVREDGMMRRTQDRPLPAARRSLLWGQGWGVAMGVCGLFVLLWKINLLTAALGAAALGSYVFIYTPLKKSTELNTLIGAIPGAIPPVMGWTAVRGELDWEAGVLGGLLFFWQLPHFLAIAWICREDYQIAGFKMIGSDGDASRVGRQATVYAAALWPVSLLYGLGGVISLWSLAVTFLLGAGLVWKSFTFWRCGDLRSARHLFWGSILYLPLVLGAWCLGKL